MNLLSLPRRKPRPAPRHAAPAAPPAVALADPFPGRTPGSWLTEEDFRRPVPQEDAPGSPEPAGPDGDTATFTPDFAEGAPEDRQRPYAPPNAGPPWGVDAGALESDAPAPGKPDPEPLPATLLLALPREGGHGSAKEILSGWPGYAGMRVTETGQRVAGLCIGGDADVLVCIENPSAGWWDELIAQAQRTRDAQAYGGFRAAPAVPPVAPPAAAAGGAR